MKICFLSTTLLVLVLGSYARPDGAPDSACSTLMPVHKGTTGTTVKPQASQSPFAVSAVKFGNKIQVTISSPVGEEFQGFILQAQSDKKLLIDGEFTSSQIAKATDCLGGKRNTLTHTSAEPKTQVITEWTPKETVNEDIVFNATVLKTYGLFWTNVHSSPVRMSLDEPLFPTEQDSKTHSLYDGCFRDKGCFGLPYDCVQAANCQVLLTYSNAPGGVKFNMYGFLDSPSYMAMALSDDNKMGGDSVTECIRDENDVIARFSYNVENSKSNSRTVALPKDLYNSSFNNGLSSCSWTTHYISRLNDHDYHLADNTYYVLLATGPVVSGRLQVHTDMASTPKAVNFTAYGPAEEGIEEDTISILSTTTEKDAKFTKVIPPGATNETLNGGGSQSSLNLLLLATLGLFYATRGHLYRCFNKL